MTTGLQQRGGGPYSYMPLGYQPITASAVAQFLPSVPSNASVALISVSGGSIRYRDDGVSPTASLGMPIAAGQEFQYQGELTHFQFIIQSGSPTLDISYYL